MSSNQQALLMAGGGDTPSFCVADPYRYCGPVSADFAATSFSPLFMGSSFSWQEGSRLIRIFNQTSDVSNAAVAIYSDNEGVTWQSGTIPAGQYYRIVRGNSRFVAGAGYGSMSNVTAVSTDGITWTAGANLPASDYWYSWAFGAGTIVAVRYASTGAATSTDDGASWTTRSVGTSSQWSGAAYSTGDARFLLVSRNSTATRVSADGITWSAGPALVGISGAVNVTYGNGRFVATQLGAGQTAVSVLLDGESAWRASYIPAASTFGEQTGFWNGTVWVLRSADGLVFLSADAFTWDVYALKNTTPAAVPFWLGTKAIFYWPSLGETQHLTLDRVEPGRTVLALNADGTSQGSAVVDDSIFTAPSTVSGTVTTSADQAVFGQSVKFSGVTTELVSFPASTAYAPGGGEFTIEGWFFLAGDSPLISATRSATIVSTWPALTGWSLQIVGTSSTTGTGILFEVKNSGAGSNVSVAATIPKNQWHHIAVCRAAGTLRIFLNGVTLHSVVYATALGSGGQPLFIGRNSPLGAGFEWPINGFIDEVRITNSVGRYTGDFDVPTAPFSSADPFFAQVALLVHFDYENLPDFSCYRQKAVALTDGARVQSSVVKFGAGAVVVPNDGSSSLNGIVVTDSVDFDFGNADFTIEFWAYRTANTYSGYLFDLGTAAVRSTAIVGTDGLVDMSLRASGGTTTANNIAQIELGQWTHIAVQRTPFVFETYFNGSLAHCAIIQGGAASTVNSTADWFFGRQSASSTAALNGYLDEIRVTRNVAKFQSFYGVPTSAFPEGAEDPHWGSVSLLLHMDGADGGTVFTDSSDLALATSVSGGAVTDADMPKFGTAALNTQAAGSVLVAYAAALDLSGAAFTVEGWAKCEIGASGFGTLIDFRGSAAIGTSWSVFINYTNESINVFNGPALTTPAFSRNGAVPQDGSWFHWAVQRSGTKLELLVDGVVAWASDFDVPTTSATGVRIGSDSDGTNSFLGAIDEVRITKGIARYAGGFSPPTLPYCDSAGTVPTSGTEGLVGRQVTAQQGTVAVQDPWVALMGAQAALQQATIVAVNPDRTAALTGAQTTLQQAAAVPFTADRAAALSGQAFSAAQGTVAIAPYPNLISNNATFSAVGATAPFARVTIRPNGTVEIESTSIPPTVSGTWIDTADPNYSPADVVSQYRVVSVTIFSGGGFAYTPTPPPTLSLSLPFVVDLAVSSEFQINIAPTSTNPRYGEVGYFASVRVSVTVVPE
jgi:hypothetical protein